MNNISLLAIGIKDWFISILDNIPRVIYFFFAAFTSGIDALQCIIRKLAGLDTFWTSNVGGVAGEGGSTTINSNTNAVFGKDPLTEFIYGTLGIGDSSVAYKALNTVFISLSIFALIVLAITTMVAMIKSHYSEEYQNTNPWKYIYTAIKSVLTYAILPVVVVIGLQLSGLILRTLDNITAGTSNEKVVSVFGNNVATTKFEKSKVPGTDKEYYSRYDFFGAGTATTSQTFGGMLFNAAAYSSNRARGFNVHVLDNPQKISTSQAAKTGIFAQSSCANYSKLSSDEEKQDYLAYQIDFAFANNIGLKQRLTVTNLTNWFSNVRYYRSTDFVGFGSTAFISSFSKYNIPMVWMFYDLWQFQFIVAFGGGASILGLILSIIIGMMTRLIKGAVLFLLYPPVLSIAPLDNFKAFKSWGSEFMKQILLAYGTVVGFNLLMIVLPLVQNISWFGPGMGVIDALINMIILIVGLLMTKDIIALVGGFVGSGSAAEEGEKYKSQVAGAVKTGFSASATIGGGVVRAGLAPVRITGGVIKSKIRNARDLKALNEEKDNKNRIADLDSDLEARKKATHENRKTNKINKISDKLSDEKLEDFLNGSLKKKYKNDPLADFAKEAYDGARAQGSSKKKAREYAKNQLGWKDPERFFDSSRKEAEKMVKDSDIDTSDIKLSRKEEKEKEKLEKRVKRADEAHERIEKGESSIKQNKHGVYQKADMFDHVGNGLKASWKMVGKGLDEFFDAKKAGKSMSDAFIKSMTKMGQVTGVDKMINGMKDIFKDSMTMSTKKFTGDNLAKENQKQTNTKLEEQKKTAQETNKILQELVKSQNEFKKVNTEGFNSLANILRDNKPKEKDSSSDSGSKK